MRETYGTDRERERKERENRSTGLICLARMSYHFRRPRKIRREVNFVGNGVAELKDPWPTRDLARYREVTGSDRSRYLTEATDNLKKFAETLEIIVRHSI